MFHSPLSVFSCHDRVRATTAFAIRVVVACSGLARHEHDTACDRKRFLPIIHSVIMHLAVHRFLPVLADFVICDSRHLYLWFFYLYGLFLSIFSLTDMLASSHDVGLSLFLFLTFSLDRPLD